MIDPESTKALSFLGRRLERLFFVGILLVVVCFLESYLAAASHQLAKDNSLSALTLLYNEIAARQDELDELFKKPTPASPIGHLQGQDAERIAETRRKLGLPLEGPQEAGDARGQPRTYEEALSKILEDVAPLSSRLKSDLAKIVHFDRSPALLLKDVQEQRVSMETTTTSVWGIDTPRALHVNYAGINYKVPFQFLSITLALALAPLLVGWLGAVYITRQRELAIISTIEDFKLAFPHVLNLLPVTFDRVRRMLRYPYKARARYLNSAVNRKALAFCRAAIVLFFSLSMLSGFAYSLFQIWAADGENISFPFVVGIVFAIIMFAQSFTLLIQESIMLYGKEFYE
jgi:hypothetical protein